MPRQSSEQEVSQFTPFVVPLVVVAVVCVVWLVVVVVVLAVIVVDVVVVDDSPGNVDAITMPETNGH